MKNVILLIMDGWGYSEYAKNNAVAMADTPNFDRLWQQYPHTLLNASGRRVGLPAGLMGNSEVGHLNIGAGRIVYQNISRIDKAIEDGEFFANPHFLEIAEHVRANNTSLHFMGLVSDGGVHSSDNHYCALIDFAKRQNIAADKLFFHAILDGRDTPPKSGIEHVKKLEAKLQSTGIGRIATVMGRYYAMDRDKRWERNKLAYNAYTNGEGKAISLATAGIEESYAAGDNDEFVKPCVVVGDNGKPIGTVKDGDAILFFNFRGDRARQITRAFVDEDFSGFARKNPPQVKYLCMAEYDATIKAPVAYPPVSMQDILSEVLAKHNKKQFRVAETEKYAHVTFFFNGGTEAPFPGEERLLIPSPKVATYDLQPEMSAEEVCSNLIRKIATREYDMLLVNFANPDMVGHTGILPAAIKAVETVDACVGKIVDSALANNGLVMITSDHGNAEKMEDADTQQPHTAHTTSLVPFVFVGNQHKSITLAENKSLCDIAPTILKLLELPQPTAMTGQSIF